MARVTMRQVLQLFILSLVVLYLVILRDSARRQTNVVKVNTEVQRNFTTPATRIPHSLEIKEIDDRAILSIVFLKTHKTGSSTVASILQRYGYVNNLTFLVPDQGSFINYAEMFKASDTNSTFHRGRNSSTGFHMLTNHARYDRLEMASVFHDAVYVSILRDPVSQFESAFYYFEISKSLSKGKNSLENFMENPMKNFVVLQETQQYFKQSMHNQQMYDLGVELADMYREEVIDAKIKELDRDFDLVMISEYFDESLLLLRKLLSWQMDDIVYLMKGRRAVNYRHGNLSDIMRAKIRSWNRADGKLYLHFNETLWRRIKEYGSDFDGDLAILRQKLHDAFEECFNTSSKSTYARAEQYSLKRSASTWCQNSARSDFDYTELLRKRMTRAGVPLYEFRENHPIPGQVKKQTKLIKRSVSKRKNVRVHRTKTTSL